MRQHRGEIQIHWRRENYSSDNDERVRYRVENQTRRTIEVQAVTAGGPFSQIAAAPIGGRISTSATYCHLGLEVLPGLSGEFEVRVTPDAARLAQRLRWRCYRPRWVSWFSWHVCRMVLPPGVAFSIRLMIRRSSADSRVSIFTQRHRMNEHKARQIVQKAASAEVTTGS